MLARREDSLPRWKSRSRGSLISRLTRLLASDPTEGSFKIDPVNWRPFVANDAGQVALKASVGGVAGGIVTYNNGNLDLLASTGTPGVFPGSVTREFNNLAMNDRGDVFVTTWADWGRGNLTRISPSVRQSCWSKVKTWACFRTSGVSISRGTP